MKQMCVNPQDLRSQISQTTTFSNSCFSTSCTEVGWNEDWHKCKLKIEITKITYIRLRYLVDFSWMISLATVSWLTKVASQPCFRCVPQASPESPVTFWGWDVSQEISYKPWNSQWICIICGLFWISTWASWHFMTFHDRKRRFIDLFLICLYIFVLIVSGSHRGPSYKENEFQGHTQSQPQLRGYSNPSPSQLGICKRIISQL